MSVARYESIDGKVFASAEEANKYDIALVEVDEVIFALAEQSVLEELITGMGYVQLTREKLDEFVKGYERLVSKYVPSGMVFFREDPLGEKLAAELKIKQSPVFSLWMWANRIDQDLKLWGDSIFARYTGLGLEWRIK